MSHLLEALNPCGPSSYLPPSFRALEDCGHGGGWASYPGRDTRLWLKGLIHPQAPEAAQIKEDSQTSAGLKAGRLHSGERGGMGMGTAPLRSTARMGARSRGCAEQHRTDTRMFANKVSHTTVILCHFPLLCCPSNTSDGQPWNPSQGPLGLTCKNVICSPQANVCLPETTTAAPVTAGLADGWDPDRAHRATSHWIIVNNRLKSSSSKAPTSLWSNMKYRSRHFSALGVRED